ncbi:MAG: hypothetical protein Q4Q03_02265 [Bowdeniella nasicola]|nr:hypothetical protein [Bowdeniella nasicola]
MTGRPSRITYEAIVAAGVKLGMEQLSLTAVAAELQVSAAALYRHIAGRWELERIVGEAILEELTIDDDPSLSVEQYLLSFSRQLWEFIDEHPGMGGYLAVLFPRGRAGAALLRETTKALQDRGMSTPVALVLPTTVTSLTIALAALAERDRQGRANAGYHEELARAEQVVQAEGELGVVAAQMPAVSPTGFCQILIAAAISDLLGVAERHGDDMNALVAHYQRLCAITLMEENDG